MSSWRVSQHYGFGAARIPIHPEPHRMTRSGLRVGFADMHSEFVEGGPVAMIRRTIEQGPAIVLGLLLITAFFVTMLRDHSDFSPIEVVMLEELPLPAEVIPEPIPLVVEEPPVPVEPEPVEVVRPEPLPAPVEVLAARPKPPPPPKAKKATPKPPVMPRVARVEPKPPPVRQNRPDRAPRPQAVAKPRIEVAALAPQPKNTPRAAPRRLDRVPAIAPPTRANAPRLDSPKAPRVALPSEAPPPRGFRVAAAPKSPRVRGPQVMPGVAPAPQSPAAPVQATTQRVRAPGPRPELNAARVAPAMAMAPSSAPSATTRTAAPARRDDRPAPKARERRGPRPIGGLAQAPTLAPAGTVPATPTRVTRAQQTHSPQGDSTSRPGLAGVPLADLAVCLSDRDEDRLKQAVVAAVTTQKECVSRAGTYRFVETKNLNSFLMRIDRAAGRAVGDRCDELRHALECLKGAGQRAAR